LMALEQGAEGNISIWGGWSDRRVEKVVHNFIPFSTLPLMSLLWWNRGGWVVHVALMGDIFVSKVYLMRLKWSHDLENQGAYGRTILKKGLEELGCGMRELDCTGSWWDPMAGFCEHGNEPSVSEEHEIGWRTEYL
jgi:hypothetical protein